MCCTTRPGITAIQMKLRCVENTWMAMLLYHKPTHKPWCQTSARCPQALVLEIARAALNVVEEVGVARTALNKVTHVEIARIALNEITHIETPKIAMN